MSESFDQQGAQRPRLRRAARGRMDTAAAGQSQAQAETPLACRRESERRTIAVHPALPKQARSCCNRSKSRMGVTRSPVRDQDKAMSSGPKIFDRSLLACAPTARALAGPRNVPARPRCRRLGERLSAVLRRFDIAVDLGTPTDAVRRVLAASGKVHNHRFAVLNSGPGPNVHFCVSPPTRRRCRLPMARSIW